MGYSQLIYNISKMTNPRKESELKAAHLEEAAQIAEGASSVASTLSPREKAIYNQGVAAAAANIRVAAAKIEATYG